MMRKQGLKRAVLALVATLSISWSYPTAIHAANSTATIDIDSSNVTTYNPDFRGMNNEPERTAIKLPAPPLRIPV